MDGLTLAHTCRERSALPAFIMLTSFEEFDYIKQAMGAGVVDYLVKLDLTPENLKNALARAAEKVKKERALLGEVPVQENLAESVRSYQERFSCGCTPGCSRTKPHWSSLCSTWS